jgi:hypothetical protein
LPCNLQWLSSLEFKLNIFLIFASASMPSASSSFYLAVACALVMSAGYGFPKVHLDPFTHLNSAVIFGRTPRFHQSGFSEAWLAQEENAADASGTSKAPSYSQQQQDFQRFVGNKRSWRLANIHSSMYNYCACRRGPWIIVSLVDKFCSQEKQISKRPFMAIGAV